MVVIIVPVLRRPHRVEPLIASIERATDQPHRVLFVCTPEDEAQRSAVDAAGAERIDLEGPLRAGDYARKINAGYRASTEPLLFLAADDLNFHPHWLERAADLLTDRVQVIGTNDLGNPAVRRGRHATHSLVTREYCDHRGTVDGPGQVLHEGYEHNFVDSEFVATAMARRAWAFARRSVVEHLHPHWNKGAMDSTYERGLAGFERDRRVFRRRSEMWKGRRL